MSAFLPLDLIREVKIRPGIYNKEALIQPTREHKQQLWLEVAESVTPEEEWESYTQAEKESRIVEVSNRWKNLRDHFYREIKLLESGQANKKRRYIYFDEMEFVRPYIGYKQPPLKKREKKSIDSVDSTLESQDFNIEDIFNSSYKNSDTEIKHSPTSSANQANSNSKSVIKHATKARQIKPSTSNSKNNTSQKEDVIRNFNVLKKVGGAKNPAFKIRESDLSFCLSLVPTLRQLSDVRKLSAKIDILKVLHKNMYEIERETKKSNARLSKAKPHIDNEEMLEECEVGDIKCDPLNDSDNSKPW